VIMFEVGKTYRIICVRAGNLHTTARVTHRFSPTKIRVEFAKPLKYARKKPIMWDNIPITLIESEERSSDATYRMFAWDKIEANENK